MFDLLYQLRVSRKKKQIIMIWQSKVQIWEDFVAARNICIHMVQDITSSGGDLEMLMEFR